MCAVIGWFEVAQLRDDKETYFDSVGYLGRVYWKED